MGKRGPAPKGGYPEKTKVLSTRITAALRDELQRAASRSGRSLSSEIEHRLRRSFTKEERIEEMFGGRETCAIMRLIANVITVTAQQAGLITQRARGKKTTWLNDPYVYDQAVMAVRAILEVFRPAGDIVRPTLPAKKGATKAQIEVVAKALKVLGEGVSWGPGYALHVLRAVRDAEQEIPLPSEKGDQWSRLTTELKEDLGPVAKRLGRGNSK